MFDTLIARGRVRPSAPALIALLAAVLLLGACVAPSTTGSAVAAEPPQSTDDRARTPDAGPTGAVRIDKSCKTDADCTVKNVGNCCGYYPACVNVNSPTDPEGVKAACAESGMMSVCGFPAIEGCQCVEGSCQAQSAALPAIQ
ncbi:hypothetical protein [Marilutibacter maris]|uniref:Uncharacterized protein n=1 Tax=Marilutibacter maris TaxID=1605891 RepID=A0A2U9TB61_9GAMM|nr:hypothetical protein [Lysobacter maris]AWV08114.1 hypothetical protein C9I47_2436 [Lysobacter maris]